MFRAFQTSRKVVALIIFLGGILYFAAGCSPKKPPTRADLQKWNQTTLLDVYKASANNNPKWDADATEALTQFARLRNAAYDERDLVSSLAGSAADAALQAGCPDPMVNYIGVYLGEASKSKPYADRIELYRSAAQKLADSEYPPIRKFYGAARAAGWLWQRHDKKLWQEVVGLRHQAIDRLGEALADKTLPSVEACSAADDLFDLLRRNEGELTNAFMTLDAALAGNKEQAAARQLVRAKFYLVHAWQARGNGTASEVTEQGWKLFGERLAEAEKAVNQAWSLNPYDENIPTLMISVLEGRQKSREDVEKWFQRAMKLDVENYDACRAKLHYLLPQWYGSREEMLAFGRECVASTNWGGRVPLILLDAHSEFSRTLSADERPAYWREPDVWPDIQTAYETFSRVNPNATKFRYPYASYAFRCGQWEEFSRQIDLIRQNDFKVNSNYFGGAKALAELLEFASTNKPAR